MSAYLFATMTRTGAEVVGVLLQLANFPYPMVDVFICRQYFACQNEIDCYVSRPSEKSILFLIAIIVSITLTLLSTADFLSR